jgi:excisionase family DNA binding protein
MSNRRKVRTPARRAASETKTPPTQEAGRAAQPPATDLLDANGAMDLLKTSRPTFYRWLRTGKIKGLKVGRQWRFERAEIERFLKGEEPRIELRVDIGPLVEELRKRADALEAPALTLPEDTALQSAIAQVIRLAVSMRASDVHVHPLADESGQARRAVVRYRIDGVLHSVAEFDIRLLAPIMQQWKAMGACDPHQLKRPQDARMMFDAGRMPLDVRLCFVPSAPGESLT